MDIGKIYSFNTIAPTVLGDYYENMKLVRSGLGDQFLDVADLQTKNIQVSNLTGTPPDDVTNMLFHMFINNNNEQIVIANDWIDVNTIRTGSRINLSLVISNITLEDRTVILQTLDRLGYNMIIDKTLSLESTI